MNGLRARSNRRTRVNRIPDHVRDSTAFSSWRSSPCCRPNSSLSGPLLPEVVGSLAQRMGYLPVTFNLDGDDRSDPRGVGRRGARRPGAPAGAARALSALRMFVSTTTMTGQQVAREQPPGRHAVSFPVRPRLVVEPHPAARQAAALHHDGDGDVAEPAACLPARRASRRCWSTAGFVALYPRYRLARRFFRRVLADVDRCCMQSEESARRDHRHRRATASGSTVTGSSSSTRSRSRRRRVPVAATTACCAISASRRSGR